MLLTRYGMVRLCRIILTKSQSILECLSAWQQMTDTLANIDLEIEFAGLQEIMQEYREQLNIILDLELCFRHFEAGDQSTLVALISDIINERITKYDLAQKRKNLERDLIRNAKNLGGKMAAKEITSKVDQVVSDGTMDEGLEKKRSASDAGFDAEQTSFLESCKKLKRLEDKNKANLKA